MRLVVQRVRRAWVDIEDTRIAEIGPGLLVLVGIAKGDGTDDAAVWARKISKLRIFDDDHGVMNLSAQDVGAQLLLVSQFTLLGQCTKGCRPSWIEAANPAEAKPVYEHLVTCLRELGHHVETGRFRTHMIVGIENDGPVTLVLESRV